MSSIKMISTAISAVLALSAGSTGAIADSQTKEKHDHAATIQQIGQQAGTERCYGVAKAHRNDCSTSKHGCAGEAMTNNDKKEWVSVPTGLCNKITGGSLTESNTTKDSV